MTIKQQSVQKTLLVYQFNPLPTRPGVTSGLCMAGNEQNCGYCRHRQEGKG